MLAWLVRAVAPTATHRFRSALFRTRFAAIPESSQSPVASSAAQQTARAAIDIDTRRQQLIGVRTVEAKRQSLAQTIRTVGTVRYDETRQADVNLKLEGWIRDLFVD